MSSINNLAERAYRTALLRGQVYDYIDHDETVSSLAEEYLEFVIADEQQKSPHMPDVSHAVEELADIMIVCMTELYRRDINVEEIIKAKIGFNEKRIDREE